MAKRSPREARNWRIVSAMHASAGLIDWSPRPTTAFDTQIHGRFGLGTRGPRSYRKLQSPSCTCPNTMPRPMQSTLTVSPFESFAALDFSASYIVAATGMNWFDVLSWTLMLSRKSLSMLATVPMTRSFLPL